MAKKRPLESEQWTQFLESSSDESDEDDTCFEDSLQQLRALLGARYKVINYLPMNVVELQDLDHLDLMPAVLQTSDDHSAPGQQSQPSEPAGAAAAAAAAGPSESQSSSRQETQSYRAPRARLGSRFQASPCACGQAKGTASK